MTPEKKRHNVQVIGQKSQSDLLIPASARVLGSWRTPPLPGAARVAPSQAFLGSLQQEGSSQGEKWSGFCSPSMLRRPDSFGNKALRGPAHPEAGASCFREEGEELAGSEATALSNPLWTKSKGAETAKKFSAKSSSEAQRSPLPGPAVSSLWGSVVSAHGHHCPRATECL
jgi:hypothetical protein